MRTTGFARLILEKLIFIMKEDAEMRKSSQAGPEARQANILGSRMRKGNIRNIFSRKTTDAGQRGTLGLPGVLPGVAQGFAQGFA